MRYIPEHIKCDIKDYSRQGHTFAEMMRLLREHYPKLSDKTVRRELYGKQETRDI